MTTTLTRDTSSASPLEPNSVHTKNTPGALSKVEGWLATLVGIALVAAGFWSLIDLGFEPATLWESVDNARNFISRIFPLDFPPVGETAALVAETLAIVFLATLLSVVLSVPTALAAAALTTKGSLSRSGARVFIVLMRAIPDLILVIFFVRVFGLGAIPGIIAMGLHSIGMVAKLYADAIESLDNGPYQAITAAGGSRLQRVTSAIIPQLMPQLIATALHRFDINLRTSVVLGYVGVGGLGLAIADAMGAINFQRGMALAVIVLVLCIAVELLAGALRTALLGHKKSTSDGFVTRQWKSLRSPVAVGPKHSDAPRTSITPPWTGARIVRFTLWSCVAALTVASLIGLEISWEYVSQGLRDLPSTISLFFPPATAGIWSDLVEALKVTVQIGFAATLLGTFLAIPIGVLAASNCSPYPWLRDTCRMTIVVIRGIPELILAIVFVVISGMGPIAGTLALAIGAVGLLSKLIADSLEETDVDVQTALTAHGAGRWQVFCAATLRQAAPAFVAHILYLLDVNIRSATLLGIVGAGGIGFFLLNSARVQEFGVVTTITLMVLAVVLAVELLAMWLRKVVK